MKTSKTFTFDADLWSKFHEITKEMGLKRSVILNSFIREWIKENES